MTCTHYNFPVPEEKMVRVITDTDLCNEADDPFAVVPALLSPPSLIMSAWWPPTLAPATPTECRKAGRV